MKKFLSLVLALVMTASLVTVSAGAKEFKDDTDVNYDEAVAVISEIGVVDGYEDGSFKPSNTLTRGAAAKIICNLILGPTTAAELKADTAPYKDVPVSNVFSGYIAYCAKEGIISGYADGSFRPAGTLTGYAFMKMLLGALGYDSANEGYTGANWSIAVAKQAIGIGLNAGLVDEFNGVDFVTREEAALYAFNTLKATMVDYEQKITTTINGVEVVLSQGNEKPVTWTQGKSNDGNIKDDGFVQFAEEFFPDLARKDDSTKFEEPANTWVNDKKEIGTFERTDLLVETYTTEVTGKDLYDLLKSGVIKDNDLEVYVDGLAAKGAELFEEKDLVRSNNEKLGATGDGVVTKVYLNTDEDLITVVSINTYLAKATADYNEKKEYAPLTVYEKDATGRNINVDIEDVASVADVKEDTFYQVNISYKSNKNGDVVVLKAAEVLEDSTVTKFSANDNAVTKLTVGGEEYKANVKAFYDDEILNEYNENLLTDNTYNVYVDANGYFIGVDLFEGTNNYVFITGYDLDGSHIAVKSATAAAIFTDGTMKTIKVDVKDTNENITAADADDQKANGKKHFTEWANGNNAENNWYTYTVANDVYTLKPADRSIKSSLADASTIRTDSLFVDGQGVNTARVYGEDATVFLTADTDDVSKPASAIGITEVTGMYTGVQSVEIELEAKDATVMKGNVFAVYDSDHYMIAAVVLGDAIGSNDNLAYILSGPKSEEYKDGVYYWEFDAVMDGVIKTFTAKSNYPNDKNLLTSYKNNVLELRFDGDYVTALKTVDPADIYDKADATSTKITDESVYFVKDLVKEKNIVSLSGNTLYVTNDQTDYGLAIGKDAKAVVIQTENGKTKKTEFASVASAVNYLADAVEGTAVKEYEGDIFAVLNSNTSAAWVVFNSDSALNTGSGSGSTPTVDGLGIAVDTKSLQVVAKFKQGTPAAAQRQQIVLALRDAGVNVSFIDSGLAYAVDNNGNYYTIYVHEYFEVTVDGKVIDRVEDVAGSNEKATVDYTANGAGTGYKDASGNYQAYSVKVLQKGTTAVTSHMSFETGYVKVVAESSITKTNGQINSNEPSDVQASNDTATFIKASEAVKVDVKYTKDTGVTGDHYVWVEYTTADGVTATSKQTVTEAALKAGDVTLSFNLGTQSKDVTAVEVKASAIPASKTLTAPSVTGTLNGLNVTAVADKVSGQVGDTVRVTVTVSGKASAQTTLTISGTADGNWSSTETLPGATGQGSTALVIANGQNYTSSATAVFTYTIDNSDNKNAPVVTGT